MPVHFSGLPTDQDKIYKLSKKYKFKIIEDASHSLGAKYNNENVGSCKWSDISIFSFHAVKIITTFEGGAAITNSKIVYEKLKLFLKIAAVLDCLLNCLFLLGGNQGHEPHSARIHLALRGFACWVP